MINSFELQHNHGTYCTLGGYPSKSNIATVCKRPSGFYKYVLQGFNLDNTTNKYKSFKLIQFK